MGAAHQLVEVARIPVLYADHGHDLLGQHVEAVLGGIGRFDVTLEHGPGNSRRFEEVLAVGGEKAADAGLADQVAGAPHPLQAPCHAFGRLELYDQVHRADVDAQLQRGGTDKGRQPALLERLFQAKARVAADAAVVGAKGSTDGAGALDALGLHDATLYQRIGTIGLPCLAREPEIVQSVGGALGLAAAVGKDQRRAVGLDAVQYLGNDGRPDAASGQVAEALHSGDDPHVDRFGHASIDDGDGSGLHLADSPVRRSTSVRCIGRLVPAKKACDFVEWPLSGRETDALDGVTGKFAHALK